MEPGYQVQKIFSLESYRTTVMKISLQGLRQSKPQTRVLAMLNGNRKMKINENGERDEM